VYNVAGIELAVDGSSYWASLLSSVDLSLLEYAADLKVQCMLLAAGVCVTNKYQLSQSFSALTLLGVRKTSRSVKN